MRCGVRDDTQVSWKKGAAGGLAHARGAALARGLAQAALRRSKPMWPGRHFSTSCSEIS